MPKRAYYNHVMFGKHRNLMYLVFVAFYDSMIFSKIWSEGSDFQRIIESALLFHLQFSKTGWPDLERKWAKSDPNGTILGRFQVRIKYICATVLETIRNIHTRKHSQAFYLLIKMDYIGSN